jgi:hypothetical protein
MIADANSARLSGWALAGSPVSSGAGRNPDLRGAAPTRAPLRSPIGDRKWQIPLVTLAARKPRARRRSASRAATVSGNAARVAAVVREGRWRVARLALNFSTDSDDEGRGGIAIGAAARQLAWRVCGRCERGRRLAQGCRAKRRRTGHARFVADPCMSIAQGRQARRRSRPSSASS